MIKMFTFMITRKARSLVNLILFSCFITFGYAQKIPSPKKIIDSYLDTIGGKREWSNLKTRTSIEKVSLFQSEALIETVYKTIDYYKCFLAPNSYLDAWYEGLNFTILSETSTEKWIYYDTDKSVTVMDKRRNKFPSRYPRIKPLEILNFEMIDTVIVDNEFYRIDFKDTDWNRVIAVFFDKKTYLIYKHVYSNDGRDRHEYYYNNYKEVNGLLEPYFIENYVNGKKYKTIEIKNIEYDKVVDPSIFKLPIDDFSKGTIYLEKHLSFPLKKE